MIDENGNQIPVEGDLGAETSSLTVMIPMTEDPDETEASTGESVIEKLPIEFTGEVRDFTIPAGAKIVTGTGEEVSLDSISKGSLIQLIVNETTGIVESVMVW